MPEELWTEVRDIVQEAVIKTIPKKKTCKKAKWLPEEALQIAGASLVAQRLKRLLVMRKTWVRSLGREDSPGEGNGNPLQYSCLENPMDGEAW